MSISPPIPPFPLPPSPCKAGSFYAILREPCRGRQSKSSPVVCLLFLPLPVIKNWRYLQMNREIIIRKEQPEDYLRVETIIRKAFWNLYVPGCYEHYLAHILRSHEDFIPELDLVIEKDGLVIGSVMYTKNRLIDENGAEKTDPHFRPYLHSSGIPENGLWKRADGGILPKGCPDGL